MSDKFARLLDAAEAGSFGDVYSPFALIASKLSEPVREAVLDDMEAGGMRQAVSRLIVAHQQTGMLA